MSEVRVLTSLRNAARAPLSRAELDALRAKAWLDQGIIVIMPLEIDNEFVRQGLVNIATKRFGRRMRK